MTKKEMFEQAKVILDSYKVADKAKAAILKLLEPKKGGQAINIDEIVKRDIDGNVVELLCRASNVWLPANTEFFFPDKNSKVVNAAGEGLYIGISRQADKIKKDTAKMYKASKEAIMEEILEGNIKPEEGKAKLAELQVEPDYSSVTATLPSKEEK